MDSGSFNFGLGGMVRDGGIPVGIGMSGARFWGAIILRIILEFGTKEGFIKLNISQQGIFSIVKGGGGGVCFYDAIPKFLHFHLVV